MPSQLPEMYTWVGSFFPQVQVDFVAVVGSFGPKMVRRISDEMHIPTNFMFMSTFGGKFEHDVTSLGGIRIITP